MKRKLRFYLAELGTEKDFEEYPLDHLEERLTSIEPLAYGRQPDGSWRGFRETRSFKKEGLVIGNYYWDTSVPTKKVLIRTEDGDIKWTGLEGGYREASLVKRGHVVVLRDIQGVIFLNMPISEIVEVVEKIARYVFRYSQGRGFLICKISDRGMENLKNLGKTYEEELCLAGVLRVGIRSVGRKSLAMHIDKIAYLNSEGKPSPIEEERDRFTRIGTDISLHIESQQEGPFEARLSAARQLHEGTVFVLEGVLPVGEELDDMNVVFELSQVVRSFVDFLIAKRVIVRELYRRPALTKFKVPELDAFADSVL